MDKKDLTAWLEADDAKSRELRARRLGELLDILPDLSGWTSFFGGDESAICFHEIRRCYIDGSHAAVLLLCQMFVERELGGRLYAEGWEDAKKAPFGALLEEARDRAMLSESVWHSYRELAKLRDSLAHFHGPMQTIKRTVEQEAPVLELLVEDARQAVEAMATLVWSVPSDR